MSDSPTPTSHTALCRFHRRIFSILHTHVLVRLPSACSVSQVRVFDLTSCSPPAFSSRTFPRGQHTSQARLNPCAARLAWNSSATLSPHSLHRWPCASFNAINRIEFINRGIKRSADCAISGRWIGIGDGPREDPNRVWLSRFFLSYYPCLHLFIGY